MWDIYLDHDIFSNKTLFSLRYNAGYCINFKAWICDLKGCSYQTEDEQPRSCVFVGQVDESQSSCCDGCPEYTVQIGGSLVTHQQRRGDCIGVDETSIRAL